MNSSTYEPLTKDLAVGQISDTLSLTLSNISSSLTSSLKSLLIGSIITSSVVKRPTTLQVNLGLLVREKQLIQHLYEYGVTSSYKETQLFKLSTVASCDDSSISKILTPKGPIIQVVADNFDATIHSQNGQQQTHSLAMMLLQSQKRCHNEALREPIPRLKHSQKSKTTIKDIETEFYKGPKYPVMPESSAKITVLPL